MYVAIVDYSFVASQVGTALGIIAFVSIFLRVGWFVPFTIAGFWTAWSISFIAPNWDVKLVLGTVCGFVIGAIIDSTKRPLPEVQAADEPWDIRDLE